MDSLTQIVLGAAVGEAVAGKKLGHRAMVLGGFAGFLPDFDVAVGFVANELTALGAHRGITHSLFFAITFSFVLAWLFHQLYARRINQKKGFKIGITVGALGLIGFTANLLTARISGSVNWGLLIGTVVVMAGLILLLNRTYFKKDTPAVDVPYKTFYWLFFWSIVTHPLLDCFTNYGTQLFLPFSNYRVAFNVISVADPIYTVPFLILLIAASIMGRGTKKRAITNWLGIGLSSAYMLFCVWHKTQMNRIFETALEKEGIQYSRYLTSPMILNNILWMGVAEGDTAFYHGYYSFMQEEEGVAKFNVIPKNHQLLEPYQDTYTVQRLRWFSNDFYVASKGEGDEVNMHDLRFGIITENFNSTDDLLYKFILTPQADGTMEMRQSRERPDIGGDMFGKYVDQVMAKEQEN